MELLWCKAKASEVVGDCTFNPKPLRWLISVHRTRGVGEVVKVLGSPQERVALRLRILRVCGFVPSCCLLKKHNCLQHTNLILISYFGAHLYLCAIILHYTWLLRGSKVCTASRKIVARSFTSTIYPCNLNKEKLQTLSQNVAYCSEKCSTAALASSPGLSLADVDAWPLNS